MITSSFTTLYHTNVQPNPMYSNAPPSQRPGISA